MFILQIEYEVFNFKGWKKAFENDPIDRKKAGVRRYHIFQRADNPNFVVIDLEFDDRIKRHLIPVFPKRICFPRCSTMNTDNDTAVIHILAIGNIG